jgi:hypothetical protein
MRREENRFFAPHRSGKSLCSSDIEFPERIFRFANFLVVKIRRTSPRRSEVFSGFPAHSQGSICRIRSTSTSYEPSQYKRRVEMQGTVLAETEAFITRQREQLLQQRHELLNQQQALQ